MTPSMPQMTASSPASDMVFLLPDDIALRGGVLHDELLGDGVRDDGAIGEGELTFGLDNLLALPGDAGGDGEGRVHRDGLADADGDAGGEAGEAGLVGDVAHGLVEEGAGEAAVEEARPALEMRVRHIGGEDGIAL